MHVLNETKNAKERTSSWPDSFTLIFRLSWEFRVKSKSKSKSKIKWQLSFKIKSLLYHNLGLSKRKLRTALTCKLLLLSKNCKNYENSETLALWLTSSDKSSSRKKELELLKLGSWSTLLSRQLCNRSPSLSLMDLFADSNLCTNLIRLIRCLSYWNTLKTWQRWLANWTKICSATRQPLQWVAKCSPQGHTLSASNTLLRLNLMQRSRLAITWTCLFLTTQATFELASTKESLQIWVVMTTSLTFCLLLSKQLKTKRKVHLPNHTKG